MQWIPLTTAVFSLIFAAYTLYLYIVKKENCLLMWFVGLLFYGLASCMESVIESGTINLLIYRLWYLMGAIFSGTYLAMGALYCMAPRKIAFPLLMLLTVTSVYACITVFITPVDISGMHGLTSRPLPLQIRILSPFFNTAASIVMLSAIIYGIYVLAKKKESVLQGVSLILIGSGMVLPAIVGTYFRLGTKVSIYMYVMDLMGLIVILVGILLGHVIINIAQPDPSPERPSS